MTLNCQKDLDWLVPEQPHNKTLCVIGGAPSLKKNLGKLKEKIKLGCHIMTTNGSLNFLTNKGVTPEFHAQFDARAENVSFVKNAPRETIYLIGSMSDPSVTEELKDKAVILWHGGFDMAEMQKILEPYQHKPIVVIGGAYTIGLRALSLGYQLGYRKFILFGLDSSFSGEEHHAYEQSLNDNDKPIPASYNGKQYFCAPWMYRQAMNFEENHRDLTKLGCKITAVGEGLIHDMCKHLNETMI